MSSSPPGRACAARCPRTFTAAVRMNPTVAPSLHLNTSMSLPPAHLPPSAWIGHLPFACWVVEELRPRMLVELGTHHGASYLAFCQAVRHCGLDTRCYAVDTWEGDTHSGHYGEEVYSRLRETNRAHYAGFSSLMRMRFDQALPYFADGSIDLLHIDGLHTYEAVREDFESWLPKLSERAVVLFHDTLVREREFGVWRLWAELLERYPGFEFQHAHGLGVLLVGPEQPQALRSLVALRGTTDEVPVLRLFEALGLRLRPDPTPPLSERVDSVAQMVRTLRADIEASLQQRLEAEERARREEMLQIQVARVETSAAVEARMASEAQARIEIQRLQERLDAAHTDARVLRSLLQQAESRAADTQAEAERTRLEANSARMALDAARAASDTLRHEADSARLHAARLVSERDLLRADAEREHARLRDRLAEIESSTSWRVTRPVRDWLTRWRALRRPSG